MEKPRKYERSTFAKNVVLKRYDLNISAMKLAEKAKMPYPTLRDIESGRTNGSARNKEKIAKALGATVDELNTPKSAPATPSPSKERSDTIVSIVADLPALNDNQLRAVRQLISGYLAGSAPKLAPTAFGDE